MVLAHRAHHPGVRHVQAVGGHHPAVDLHPDPGRDGEERADEGDQGGEAQAREEGGEGRESTQRIPMSSNKLVSILSSLRPCPCVSPPAPCRPRSRR